MKLEFHTGWSKVYYKQLIIKLLVKHCELMVAVDVTNYFEAKKESYMPNLNPQLMEEHEA